MKILDSIASRFGFQRTPEEKPRSGGSAAAMARMVRSFDAASISRLTADFTIQNVSPDTDLFRDLRIMRARSRQLAKVDPYCVNAIRLWVRNIVGAKGLALSVKAVNGYDKQTGDPIYDNPANRLIEREFAAHSKKENYSATKTMSRAEFERLLIRTVSVDGECFIKRHRNFDNRSKFTVQIIPADCLDERLNQTLPNGNYIRLGVEKNQWGQPVAYHLRRANPVDFVAGNGTEYMIPTERIPAEDVTHLFIPLFAEQSRGIPWMFAAVYRLHMLGEYEKAEVVASRVAANKLGFVVMPEGDYAGDDEASDGSRLSDMQPGDIEQLPFGSELKNFDPQHPNASFAEFHRAVMRGIASAAGLSYGALTGDLSQANFSSARVAILDERDEYEILQGWFAEHYADDVFSDWLAMQMLVGNVPLPISKLDKFNAPEWSGRRWGWVDPLKDIQATKMEIELGLTSRQQILRENNGGSFAKVVSELGAEREAMDDAGILPPPPPGTMLAAPHAEPDGDEDTAPAEPKSN